MYDIGRYLPIPLEMYYCTLSGKALIPSENKTKDVSLELNQRQQKQNITKINCKEEMERRHRGF